MTGLADAANKMNSSPSVSIPRWSNVTEATSVGTILLLRRMRDEEGTRRRLRGVADARVATIGSAFWI